MRRIALLLPLVACRPAGTGDPIEVGPIPPAVSPDERASALPTTEPPTDVGVMVGAIKADELLETVKELAAFGTRHTLSDPEDDARGIGAARRYLAKKLESYVVGRRGAPPLRVAMDAHRVEPDGRRIDAPVDVVNVVATLPGAMPEAADRHYYVIGHYDSRASDPMDRKGDAPGANDDASGVALLVELARVMASRRYDATIVFMATAGEEQGLLGADRHARAAAEAGIDIRGVLSNDIIGDPTGPRGAEDRDRIRVFSAALPPWLSDADLQRIRTLGSASDSASRQLARFVDEVARWHDLPVKPMLVFRRDRFLRGGDHTAFNRSGFAAVRFTEVREHYDRQHQDPREEDGREYGDLPEHVDGEYLRGVTQLVGAALAHLANAPSSPSRARIITAELTDDTTLRWDPSPEPDVAGYEVVWRETTSPIWTAKKAVGKETTATIPLSKDNWQFGVRAFDEDGYRSPVAFPTAAPR